MMNLSRLSRHNMQKEIRFYSNVKEYKELSNMYYSPFIIDGVEYKTVEHYYQAAKWDDSFIKKMIIDARTGVMAKEFSYMKPGRWTSDENKEIISLMKRYVKDNKVSFDERSFNPIRCDVMTTAVKAKFDQNPKLMKFLLDTGDSILIEKSSDSYWGEGKDGTGQNNLGKILMNVRDSRRSLINNSN